MRLSLRDLVSCTKSLRLSLRDLVSMRPLTPMRLTISLARKSWGEKETREGGKERERG